MKYLILTICSLITFTLSAQVIFELDEYKASNDVTYKVGDQIKLNQGSGAYGKFLHVNIGNWDVNRATRKNRLGARNIGLVVYIKEIKKNLTKHYQGVIFIIDVGNEKNSYIDIESAIESCEVTPCPEKGPTTIIATPVEDKYNNIKKLKELLDIEAITKEEFESEKKKLLEQK